MADLAEVENKFIEIIAGVMFPNISYNAYDVTMSPVIGAPVRLYRGWPLDTQLRNDLANSTVNISIFSNPELARDTTSHLRRMTEVVTHVGTPTMTATVNHNTVTFAGTASTSECIGIAYHQHGYAYRLNDSDTPTSVAALFAANIPSCSASGATITFALPYGEKITATYGADLTTLTELHRQEQVIRVSVWCPTTELRDQVCGLIDPAIMWYDRILFAENSISGPIRNAGTHVDDMVGIEFMWRRDLLYKVEYATTYQQIEPPYVLGKTTGPNQVYV